jgi:hypothetical protein
LNPPYALGRGVLPTAFQTLTLLTSDRVLDARPKELILLDCLLEFSVRIPPVLLAIVPAERTSSCPVPRQSGGTR